MHKILTRAAEGLTSNQITAQRNIPYFKEFHNLFRNSLRMSATKKILFIGSERALQSTELMDTITGLKAWGFLVESLCSPLLLKQCLQDPLKPSSVVLILEKAPHLILSPWILGIDTLRRSSQFYIVSSETIPGNIKHEFRSHKNFEGPKRFEHFEKEFAPSSPKSQDATKVESRPNQTSSKIALNLEESDVPEPAFGDVLQNSNSLPPEPASFTQESALVDVSLLDIQEEAQSKLTREKELLQSALDEKENASGEVDLGTEFIDSASALATQMELPDQNTVMESASVVTTISQISDILIDSSPSAADFGEEFAAAAEALQPDINETRVETPSPPNNETRLESPPPKKNSESTRIEAAPPEKKAETTRIEAVKPPPAPPKFGKKKPKSDPVPEKTNEADDSILWDVSPASEDAAPPALDINMNLESRDSDNDEISTLKRYALLKEREAREKDASLKVVKQQLGQLKEKLEKSENERRKTLLILEELKTQLGILTDERDQQKHHEAKLEAQHQEQIKDLQLRMDNAQFQAAKSERRLEEFKDRVRHDLQQIRQRERDLANRLELQKRDAEALLSTKDERLLMQKREIDRLEFEIQTLQERLVEETKKDEERASRLIRAVQSLKLAQGVLSEIDDEVLPGSRSSSEGDAA